MSWHKDGISRKGAESQKGNFSQRRGVAKVRHLHRCLATKKEFLAKARSCKGGISRKGAEPQSCIICIGVLPKSRNFSQRRGAAKGENLAKARSRKGASFTKGAKTTLIIRAQIRETPGIFQIR